MNRLTDNNIISLLRYLTDIDIYFINRLNKKFYSMTCASLVKYKRWIFMYKLCYYGYFELLKKYKFEDIPLNICDIAATRGYFKLLKWAMDTKKRKYDEHTSSSAASGGHFKILKYLSEHKCELDLLIYYAAAYRGDINIFDWALRQKIKYTREDMLKCHEIALWRFDWPFVNYINLLFMPKNFLIPALKSRQMSNDNEIQINLNK